MKNLASLLSWQMLSVLVLGLLLALAISTTDTRGNLSAHGGDGGLVHVCVNDTTAETLFVHPGPGDPDIDCLAAPWPLGAGWSPVDLGTIFGVTAGTGLTGRGTTGTVILAADTTFLQQRVAGTCAAGSSIQVINLDGSVTCEPDTDTNYDGTDFALSNQACTAGEVVTGVDVSGNVTCETDAVGGGGIGGLGTIDKIAKFTSTGDIGDSVITESGGNVGIGTAIPNEQLEITGNFRLPASTTTAGVIKSGEFRFIHNFGMHNFFAGVDAGNLTTTGFGGNTGVGRLALRVNSTGFQNTGIGSSTLIFNTTGVNNTGIGANTLQTNSTGNSNTALGVGALVLNSTGAGNTGIGTSALDGNTTGSGNTAIGNAADVSSGGLSNATAIGHQTIVNASNKIRLGNVFVNKIEGQVAFSFSSDVNQKENFQAVNGEETLEKISRMTLESWNYKGHDPLEFRHYGPTAQEFFAAFGNDGIGAVGTDTTINSGDMAGIMMIAIQALEKRNAAQIADLERLLGEQKAQIRAMEERLKALEEK